MSEQISNKVGRQYDSIGGWLFLPIAFLFYNCIASVVSLITNILHLLNGKLSEYITVGSKNYDEYWIYYIGFQFLSSLIVIGFSILIIVFCLKRRKMAILLNMIYYPALILFMLIDSFFVVAISISNIFSQSDINSSINKWVLYLVVYIVLICYLAISKRVKGTFIK